MLRYSRHEVLVGAETACLACLLAEVHAHSSQAYIQSTCTRVMVVDSATPYAACASHRGSAAAVLHASRGGLAGVHCARALGHHRPYHHPLSKPVRMLILCDSVQACVQANQLSCSTCTLQICTVQACLARNMSDACLSWCGRGSRVAARAWPRRAVSCAGFVHESPWSSSPLVKVRLAQRLRWVVGVSHDVLQGRTGHWVGAIQSAADCPELHGILRGLQAPSCVWRACRFAASPMRETASSPRATART